MAEKLQALKDAQEKANMCRRNQVVFEYASTGIAIEAMFDYTLESHWPLRRQRIPAVIKVAIVRPDTSGTGVRRI